ncbi:hypothetical protein [Paraburkholderia diazotrophica]|uniref:Uncharacterized protein n=1 Tax=Paraburkholderia diazotrophica TaxID=667676 RepID=A0A1H6WD54_9BURK|nr:hypothetical protein [Paraburkholderia diazotrophica]SEJ13636.1 hypothetical protein SAMN05192539_100720 [Paraburkholderia diazotrophica]
MSARPQSNPSTETDADKKKSTDTFETDVSESGDDGTTVRQAEVREDDLSETHSSSDDKKKSP